MSTLIPIRFKVLAAVPGTSLNDRHYSKEVLEASVPYWVDKPFLLDHDLHDVEDRAIGILSRGMYGLDQTKDGKMVEGLWLHGFGRVTPKLYEKMQSTEKIPAIVRSVSIGGQGEARPGVEGGKTVSRIIKLMPQELSCISIPGIPQAHIAEVEQIQEAYRLTNVSEEEIPFPDLTKKVSEVLDKKIDTAGDSVTFERPKDEQPVLKAPPARKDTEKEPPEKKVNEPGVQPMKEAKFYKSPQFKDISSGRIIHKPATLEGVHVPRPNSLQPPLGNRVYREVPKPAPAKIEQVPIRIYDQITRTGRIEKKPLIEATTPGYTVPKATPGPAGDIVPWGKGKNPIYTYAPTGYKSDPNVGIQWGGKDATGKTTGISYYWKTNVGMRGKTGSMNQSAEIKGTKEKPPADSSSDTGATAGVGRPSKGDSRSGNVVKLSKEQIAPLNPKSSPSPRDLMKSIGNLFYGAGQSNRNYGPRARFGFQSADDPSTMEAKPAPNGDKLFFSESSDDEEYLTEEEIDELDLFFSIPDEELDMAEAWVLSHLYPERYTPPNMMIFSEAKKWIQKAIKKPGALRKTAGVGPGEKIPVSKLKAMAKGNSKTAKRARLALLFRKFRGRRKK